MIKNITFKFGHSSRGTPLSVNTTPVTVFVGPNNSGKSKVLSEIHQFCNTGQRNTTNVILDYLSLTPLSSVAAEEIITRVTLSPNPSESIVPGNVIVGKNRHRQNIPRQELVNALMRPSERSSQVFSWYLAYNTLILDGSNRIGLVNQQQAGDLQQQPHSSFQVLFRDDSKRQEVRRILYEAFGSYFVVDPTNVGSLRIRMSERPPANSIEERGWHDEAVQFHAQAIPIEQKSDGVKAFTGMITEIIAGDPIVMLIDEPEAFLHPSLAFMLGKEISKASLGSEKRLFVSTHSPNFVMGCIQSGTPINIVRLTYREQVATARLLPSHDILRLMRNPLLRSTGVLGALFYEYVVVTESDADRAFYQEINERLLRFSPNYGIPNCLFLNAQNKQTIQTIIRPLRELGIPAVGIVDVDIIKDGGSVWAGFLDGGFVPEIDKQSLATTRSAIKQKFDATGREMKREGGIDLLGSGDQESAANLFEQLAQYGLFVVRRGELESWLQELGVAGHGPSWLISIFERMGDDPDNPDYVRPSEGDVWAFIAQIRSWFNNPQRKGIPV